MSFLEDLLRKPWRIRSPQMGDHGSIRVNDMDGVAIDALEEIMETYGYRGIEFLFAAMKAQSATWWRRQDGEKSTGSGSRSIPFRPPSRN